MTDQTLPILGAPEGTNKRKRKRKRKRKSKEQWVRVVGKKAGRQISLEKAFIAHLAKFPLDGSNIPAISFLSVLGKG